MTIHLIILMPKLKINLICKYDKWNGSKYKMAKYSATLKGEGDKMCPLKN